MAFEPATGGFAASMEESRRRPETEDETQHWKQDTVDLDNAMDEHAPALHNSLKDTENLVRGVVSSMMVPRQTKRHSHGVRRSSTTTASSSNVTPKHRDHTRHSSLTHGSTNGTATPTMDEISLLINRLASERQKTHHLQTELTQAHVDLAFQTKRSEDADERLKELRKKEEQGSTKRKEMEIQISKMKEQLKFLKSQYDAAVEEIKRAQKDINALSDERQKAIDEVVREKEKVRKLQEERRLREAREQGYKEGVKEGREEGVKKGMDTGRKYGIKDGQKAEKHKQNRAMRDLVQEIIERPNEQPTQDIQPQPKVRETHHVVDLDTPPSEGRANRNAEQEIGFGRARPVEVVPATYPGASVDPTRYTAPPSVLPATAPLSRHQFDQYHPNGRAQSSPDNPNYNLLNGGQDIIEATPRLSSRQGNRVSAPPRIHTDFRNSNERPPSADRAQRNWGGGVLGHGPSAGIQHHNRHRSGSGGNRGGRDTITPPSTSTQGRSTPLEEYGILNNPAGGRASASGGLREQVNEMTPIMEGGSEPAPSPVAAYFPGAAMGSRPPSQQQASHPGRIGPTEGVAYVPPTMRSHSSPTVVAAPNGHRNAADQGVNWRGTTQPPTQHRHAGRKPASGDASGSDRYGNPAHGVHTRSQSYSIAPQHHAAPTSARTGGHLHGSSVSEPRTMDNIPPPIEVMESTPPTMAATRNNKMAAAGDTLMGSPSFRPVPGTSADPIPSPHPPRSPLTAQTELRREDFIPNDPGGGKYHPRHHRNGSFNATPGGGIPSPQPPHFDQSPNIAHPTPRRHSSALDFEPEEIVVHPSGTTPVGSEYDLSGRPLEAVEESMKMNKPSRSKEAKRRRRQGYADYDDEVPQIDGLGYGPQDLDPPRTTRSRVQSMYGIKPREQAGHSPSMPKRTPAYEAAPLPPPKSARMMSGRLPGPSGGYGVGVPPAPSPQKSTTSSQARRAMEEDLDTPIEPYNPDRREHYVDHDDDHDVRELNIDLLDRRADEWDQRSGQFAPKKLPPASDEVMEIVPPPDASPSSRTAPQDTSFLGTGGHSMPPPSPSMVTKGPLNAYVNPQDFDENNVILPPNPTFSMNGDPERSPIRQSFPVTASARSSANPLPEPVKPSDIPWATGKSSTSQLPRVSTYEAAPPVTAGIPPNTATTWGYVRDSTQTVAPVGPIGNDGLGFTFGSSKNMPRETYTLAEPPPGSTHANTVDIPGSSRANIGNIPGTSRSNANPLPPSTAQVMLERMLTPDAPQERDEEPVIPTKKEKKRGKKKK